MSRDEWQRPPDGSSLRVRQPGVTVEVAARAAWDPPRAMPTPATSTVNTASTRPWFARSFWQPGFRLDAESQLLRNPDDDRTKAFFDPEMKGKNTDKFALLFRKP